MLIIYLYSIYTTNVVFHVNTATESDHRIFINAVYKLQNLGNRHYKLYTEIINKIVVTTIP